MSDSGLDIPLTLPGCAASPKKCQQPPGQQHLDACRVEERRHWEARRGISPNGYGDTRPEAHAALRAEDDAHRATARAMDTLVRDVARQLLPLAIDEPADLIEWAEATA